MYTKGSPLRFWAWAAALAALSTWAPGNSAATGERVSPVPRKVGTPAVSPPVKIGNAAPGGPGLIAPAVPELPASDSRIDANLGGSLAQPSGKAPTPAATLETGPFPLKIEPGLISAEAGTQLKPESTPTQPVADSPTDQTGLEKAIQGGSERFDRGLSFPAKDGPEAFSAAEQALLADAGLGPQALLELYRLEKARGEPAAVGTREDYLRRLAMAVKEHGLPLDLAAERLLEFEAQRRAAGGHGQSPSLLAVAQAFENASRGLGRPVPGLGTELEALVGYAMELGQEDPQAYERLDPAALLASFVEEALGRIQEGRSWPELLPFLDRKLETAASPERKLAALRRALGQALDSDPNFGRRLAHLIARHFRLRPGEEAEALGRLRRALETVELRFAGPGESDRVEGAQAMHVTELNEAGRTVGSYILFNPLHRALPARVLAGTLLHELLHELGFGEYSAHRGQNLYFRWQRRVAASKGRRPESRYDEDQAALDRDIRRGDLVESLLGRYAPATLSAAEDDRRAVRRHYLRRALRVQEAARAILAGLEAGQWGDSWDEKGFDPGLEATLQRFLSRFLADGFFLSSRLRLASAFDPATGRHRIRPEQVRSWLQELEQEIASHRAALAASSPQALTGQGRRTE